MAAPLAFWFDFASPYAYFALDRVERLAQAHGRAVLWRPLLLWAALKATRKNKRIIRANQPRHCERSEAIHVGARCCGTIMIAMLAPVSVKDDPMPLGEMDCFASLAMTAGSSTRLLLLAA